MGRLIRIVVALVGIFVVFVGAGIIWLVFFFDANRFKPQIAEAVERATGRELRISGPLEVGLLPRVAILADGVSLSNAEGFGDQPMVRVGSLRASVELLPLIRRELRVDRITVEEPVIELAVNAEGLANWSDLMAADADGAGAGEPAAESEAVGAGLAAMAVQGVEIENGTVTWRDQRSGRAVRLTSLDFGVDRIEPGQPSRVSLRTTVDDSSTPGPLNVEWVAEVLADAGLERWSVTGSDLAVEGDWLKARSRVETMVIHARSGDVTIEGLRQQAEIAGHELVGEAPRVAYRATDGVLDVPQWTVAEGALRIDASLGGQSLNAAEPVLKAQVEIPAFDLAAWLRTWGLALDWPEGRSSMAAATAALSLVGERVAVDELAIDVGETQLRGRIAVTGFEAPALAFDLDANRLDLDPWLASGGEGEGNGDGGDGGGGSGGDAGLAPLALLAALPTEGTLRAGWLKAGGVELSDLSVPVTGSGDVLTVGPVDARLYDGSGRLTVRVEGSASEPRTDIDATFSDIQVGPLLAAAGVSDRLEGSGQMVVDVSASGLEESQWRRSASGEVRLELRDGLVRGIDIRRILDEARAARDRLRGEDVKPVETTEEDQTRFSELNATVILGDGKARNDDLVVKAPLFRINGRGDADLVANRLDYRLDVHVVKTSKGQSGRELSELEGVNVPVAVTGPLESPAVAIDVASLLAEVLKSRTGVDRQALDQKEEEAREQLDRRIEEEKDDLRNRLMRELLE